MALLLDIEAGCISRTSFDHPKFYVDLQLNRRPYFLYDRIDNLFYAKDGPLISSYGYVPGNRWGFGGAQITLRLADGTLWIPEPGSMWSTHQAECAAHFDMGRIYGCSLHYDDRPLESNVGIAGYVAINELEQFADDFFPELFDDAYYPDKWSRP
jgi:hypothetical protein